MSAKSSTASWWNLSTSRNPALVIFTHNIFKPYPLGENTIPNDRRFGSSIHVDLVNIQRRHECFETRVGMNPTMLDISVNVRTMIHHRKLFYRIDSVLLLSLSSTVQTLLCWGNTARYLIIPSAPNENAVAWASRPTAVKEWTGAKNFGDNAKDRLGGSNSQ